ncbi:forespore capture DNA-binding protein RefZ [Bacillus aquiflavi]|uniref:Forespore capture DNA-binding protein RefZ n=3 Tax=Bacillus aquiflavi TaxID=2672567 RepID=A0A6B3W209_9BACI|nr:forespore capture DNA-binding protein RefZ [Bacillus aquiflavi]MBA4537689.1 forespore capture DNA-binding protein RefZ [Bacillus aquiflavi]NEY81946.1 forespore capture DNA-binding protein RefZ [Bacillus aquiflavi]
MRKNSKKHIVDVAVSLFNMKGYSGTSVRDIAGKANVNVANISYYFQSKHGLLEYCLTSFFENYLSEIENGYSLLGQKEASEVLKVIAKNILYFQTAHLQLTRFVLREVSIDSQVIREIMSTYFMKERYYFKKVLEKGINEKEFKPISINYIIMQLKGLLTMPFLNTYYVTEVLHVLPYEQYFAEKYYLEIESWIDQVLCEKDVHMVV